MDRATFTSLKKKKTRFKSEFIFYCLKHIHHIISMILVSLSEKCVCVCVSVCVCSVVSNSFATLWIVACQTPLSMGFSRQDYWSGLPFPSLGDVPDPGIESTSLTFPALAGRFFTTRATWEALFLHVKNIMDTIYWKPALCQTFLLPEQASALNFTMMLGRKYSYLTWPRSGWAHRSHGHYFMGYFLLDKIVGKIRLRMWCKQVFLGFMLL